MLVALIAVLVWCAASVVLAAVLAGVLRRADVRESTADGAHGAATTRRDELVVELAGGSGGWSDAVVAPLLARMADDERARQPGPAGAAGVLAVRRAGSGPDAAPGPTGRSTRG